MNLLGKFFTRPLKRDKAFKADRQNLTRAEVHQPYRIKEIDAKEKGMKEFLFSLGCFRGEEIAVVSILAGTYVVRIKDARYSIDADLAKAILIGPNV